MIATVGGNVVAILFRAGTIVIAKNLPDPQGFNPKNRPVVLICDFDSADPQAVGVAITGEFDYPLPATSVPLSYASNGKCGTGLTKRSVAMCNWIVAIAAVDVGHRIGFTKNVELQKILEQVQAAG